MGSFAEPARDVKRCDRIQPQRRRVFVREITVFGSTGLAIQDLAIALAALERASELGLQALEL